MDKNEVNKIIVSYNKKISIWGIVSLLISFVILFFSINIFLKILIAVCFFLVSSIMALTVLKNKYIDPILLNELNPQKYYTVLCGTNNTTKYATDEMTVAYYMHDYNAVINICKLKIEDKKSGNYKYLFIQYLARVYFDLGDYENLKLTCERFESELSKIKNFKTQKNLRKIFGEPIKYYENYLSSDFKACKEQYKKLIDKDTSINSKLEKIKVYYLYAIACYKLGEFDEAKSYFSVIVNEGPLLCYCEIAKNYIYAIDNNQEFVSEKQSIVIEQNYEIPQGKTVKTNKKVFILWLIAVLLLTVSICTFSAKIAPSTPEKALKNTEAMTELIATFEVNQEKDLFCFYNTKQNGFSVAFLECKGEDKYSVDVTEEGLLVGGKGEIGVAKSDLIIEFEVYDNIYDIPEKNFGVKEFMLEDTTAYFCIKSVKSEKVDLSYTHIMKIEFDEYMANHIEDILQQGK